MKRSLSLASLSLAALLTLSACGSSSGEDMEGMDGMGESSAAAAPSATADTTTGTTEATSDASSDAMTEHNDADVMFAQMMIPHHQQAVEMSDMMLAKDGISPEITDLATRIKDAQGPEIQTMTGWLEAWGEPMEPEGGMESHSMESTGSDSMESDMGGSASMDGMMNEDQLSELDTAEGTEASRLFLESMIAHHEGAVGMAQDEIDDGQNPEAIDLAGTIVETQNAEIAEMKELLAGL
ncbi:DUF305 domain-containing protein [Arthrobacter sp. MDT1-65]